MPTGKITTQPIPLGLLAAVSQGPMRRIGPMRPFICTIPIWIEGKVVEVIPIILHATDPAQIARDHGATVFVQ